MIARNDDPFSVAPNTPEPGIYPKVDFAEYMRWEAVSNSSLFAAAKSMAHYRCRQAPEETPAMRLGSLCHTGRLEPLAIAERYVVMPQFEFEVRTASGDLPANPKATKAYKEKVAEFERVNHGKTVVTQGQYNTMVGLVSALSAHRRATEYLNLGQYEVSIVWRDVETGLLCKGRIDCWQKAESRVTDLKTTADASAAEKLIYNRAYHRQLAMYCDGLETLTGREQRGALIFAETSEPFGVRAAPLSEEAIEAGRDDYRRLLRQIAECRESRHWPGYDSPDEWSVPAWLTNDEPLDLVIDGESVRL